jgi:KDO2-lipid IV(A) lauroyltransferase
MKMMKSKINDILENVAVGLLWAICYLFALLPRCVRYGVFAPLVSFVMRKVVHYRYDVIMNQLRDSFPEKSEQEITDICRRYYDHLAEMVIGTLSLVGVGDRRRAKVTEFNLTDNFQDEIKDRNFVAMTSHYGFWEIALNLYLETPNHHLVVAYRPLKNRVMDKFYYRLRKNHSVDPVASQNFIRYFVANHHGINGKNIVVGLISDQNCPVTKGCCWHSFLHHYSLFFDGAEQLAMKFGLPVYYVELERIKAGYYRHHYTLIYDGVEEVKPHEITERYVRHLERTIQAKPECWMWSHKRWKVCPDENSQFYDNYKTK